MPIGAPDSEALAVLTGPGGPMEIVRQQVLGADVQVYANRLRSMRDMLALAVGHGDKTFIVYGDRRLTYAQHEHRVHQIAQFLTERGLTLGDRVAILAANHPDWVASFWACAMLGLVAVPLNAWWKRDELAFALADASVSAVICDQRRWEVIAPLAADAERWRTALVIDPDEQTAAGFAQVDGLDWVGSLDDALAGIDAPAVPEVDTDEDDIIGIFYTSGTTGRPKGATITHRQVLANLQNLMVVSLASRDQRDVPPELSAKLQPASLLVVPLFHTTGCHATMITTLASGGKLILLEPGKFDPGRALAIIEREQVTSIGGVPTVMSRLVDAPAVDDYDTSTVSRVSYGGAPASPALVERIKAAFPQVTSQLATAYGLTETASVATLNSGDDYLSHPASVGRPVPTVEVKVVDDGGDEVAAGDRGEVCITGPTVMLRGYWNRPEVNAEVIVGGWFHTGDIGVIDDDGFLYLVDRAKDMIIRAGENVYCVEIENLLAEHPDVIEAAIVGVPDDDLGEEIKAVVQVAADSSVDADALSQWCSASLAAYKVPRMFEFRTEPLPRNPSGKILKNELRGIGSAFDAAADSVL